MVTLSLIALPALVILLAMLISRLRRIPVALSALYGFRTAVVPILALLLLGYVGSVFVLQYQEARSITLLHQWMYR